LASIKSRYEVVKDFVELELHLLESILHELEETIHQLKEENKLDSEMIKEVSRDELPF
jgi:predicted nucleic acid-binding protein